MPSDPSWDIMPVASPALRERKRRRLIRSSCAYDPVGLAEPLYQLRYRDQVVMPSALDRVSRKLLIRAQAAISSALDSVADDALESPNLNDRYLDLVAHTAADEHAVSEISGLTGQAAAAAQAVRESMRQVSLAAAALVLPEPEAG